MKKTCITLSVVLCVVMLQMTVSLTGCSAPPPPRAEKPALSHSQMVERGQYLVAFGGCNHCHSPKVMTANGPVVDTTRLLSGSPADMKLPIIDTTEVTPGKWILTSSDLTAWVGPWGVSYAANLTPDPRTGSGNWDEALFIKMMRTGKFMGADQGRPIMPPMPWENIGKMTDEDLKCIFTYMHALPAVSNAVHDYVAPPEIKNMH